MPLAVAVRPIGNALGAVTAVAFPATKEEVRSLLAESPDKVALPATTTWLPPSIQQWLTSMECSTRDMVGRVLNPPTMPVLSKTDKHQLTQCLWGAGTSDAARVVAVGRIDRSNPDSAAGSSLPLEVVSG